MATVGVKGLNAELPHQPMIITLVTWSLVLDNRVKSWYDRRV